jgi:hypothetical protein
MKIEQWDIGRVTPYERNPRKNDDAVDAVASSIREFGFRVPIVVDAEGVIIAGHTRLKATQRVGLAKVPVHVAKGLGPEQARALRIADNKTGELATWDMDLLPLELADLRDAEFDLSVLGFDMSEVEAMLAPQARECRVHHWNPYRKVDAICRGDSIVALSRGCANLLLDLSPSGPFRIGSPLDRAVNAHAT